MLRTISVENDVASTLVDQARWAGPAHSLRERLYPEVGAGGFARRSHRLSFMVRVNAMLRPDMDVLDFGAGRGAACHVANAFVRSLSDLRPRCQRVVGADVDPLVLENPAVSEAVVLQPNRPLPFHDDSFDLIVSYAVFEHVANPEHVAAELRRVLRPGGWLCAWTPNRWSYFAIGASLLPKHLHARVLAQLSPARGADDAFPTAYRMNTGRALARLFPRREWSDHSYTANSDVRYHGGVAVLARVWQVWGALAPPDMRDGRYIFLRKR